MTRWFWVMCEGWPRSAHGWFGDASQVFAGIYVRKAHLDRGGRGGASCGQRFAKDETEIAALTKALRPPHPA